MSLLVIDGNSIANRAFYGIKILTTKDGKFTNAIYGFLNILHRTLQDISPAQVAIAFDLKKPTFRHQMYDGYKANRKGMPQELAEQMPVLKQLLQDLGFNVVTKQGFEADDILGTLSNIATQKGEDCYLLTGDRDSLQLINQNVKVLLTTSKMGKSETIVMDEKAVFEKYGVTPKQLIDVKSLMGDTSDNIPGVAGVGEKTALGLIQKFNCLDEVYNNMEDSFIKKGAREKLLKDKEQAYLSYDLAKINLQVPIETNLDSYVRANINTDAARQTLQSLDMFSQIDRFLKDEETTKAINENLENIDVIPFMPQLKGDVYSFILQDNVYFIQKNNIYECPVDSDDFLNIMQNNQIELYVFHSKAYYHIAFSNNIDCENIVFDAKLAAYLLNPSSAEYDITKLAQEYGIEKEFNCENEQATVFEKLVIKLVEEIKTFEMTALLNEIELPLAKVLADMEHTGIALDVQGLQAFGEAIKLTLDTSLQNIYQLIGYEFNVNSPKQLGEALFEKLQLPTGKKTKSGYSTNAETLEKLKDEHPVIPYILEYRTYQKLHSTYVEGLLKVVHNDGKIHSTFNQTETRTGRISSGEPNLQNIPVRTKLGSQLRKFFVAQTGKTLLDADYSQIELRILAHISDDKTMQQAFLQQKDIHLSTAAKIYNLPENMVTPQLRNSAKAVNFGIVYGISAFSLSKDINVSVKQADEFIKNYLETFSGVKEYMNTTIEFAKQNGYVKTLYSRRRNLPELQSSNFNIRGLGERMAMNTPIQGTAADIIKIAMVRVYNRLKQEGLKSKLILQVHDELIVEAYQDEQEKASIILSEEMQNAAKLSVPLLAEVNCGENWYKAKG